MSKMRGRPPGSKNKSPLSTSAKQLHDHDLPATATEDISLESLLDPSFWEPIHQYAMQQREGTGLVLNTLKKIQFALCPDLKTQQPRRRSILKCSLSTSEDRKVFDDYNPRTLVELLQSQQNGWEDVRAVEWTDDRLTLTLKSPDAVENLRDRSQEFQELLKLSSDCNLQSEEYLVKALQLNFTKGSMEQPNQYVEEWSKENDVRINRAYWTNSQLVLSLGSLADALSLCNKPSVFLNGGNSIVKPFDQRSVPFFCYNCFRPSHKKGECPNETRCGRCAAGHDVKVCPMQVLQCPNCQQGHAAWDLACTNVNVVKMRKECTKVHEEGPRWAKTSQQHSSAFSKPQKRFDPMANPWFRRQGDSQLEGNTKKRKLSSGALGGTFPEAHKSSKNARCTSEGAMDPVDAMRPLDKTSFQFSLKTQTSMTSFVSGGGPAKLQDDVAWKDIPGQ